jgi:signal transduction histidine kinase
MKAGKDHHRRQTGRAITRTNSPSKIKRTRRITASDKVRFEEMEKLNKHLIEVNQLKDEFLANTSHELRTPLNSIIGFLTLITEGYYDDNNELKLFTRNALDSAYHLLSVINDLLDLSKIESGGMQVQVEKVYVQELLSEVSSLFSVQADQKGVGLEVETKGTPLFASADLRKLKQVLINLIGNAIKFTTAGSIKISVDRQNGTLRFSIKDTGIGIPKEKQDRLFQKFFQIDGGTTRRFGGTGLGLVISKHFVEMMGGQIKLESRGAGAGTTVSFTIPRWTREEE